jgi:hypothetical protein
LASVILFAAIGLGAVVYQGAILSSGKAVQSLQLLGSVPAIASVITEELRTSRGQTRSGSGQEAGVSYTWQADQIASGPVTAGEVAPLVTGDPNTADTTLTMWEVKLQVESSRARREFTFLELTW